MTTPRPGDARPIAVGISLCLTALAVFGAGGLGLAWDGGWFAFRTMDLGEPTFLHGRVLGWMVQAPALLARVVVDDPAVLSAVLGMGFVAVPAIALLASARVVFPERPELLVFPVLGLGLAGVAGQAFAVSEALMAVSLAWPLVLAAALGRLRRHRVLIALLVAAIALVHPFAIPILGGASGIVALRAWRRPLERRTAAVVVASLVAVTVILMMRYALFGSSYEAGALSLDRLGSQFRGSVGGAPLIAIVAATGVAAWLAWRPADTRSGRVIVLAAVLVAGVVLVAWATDPAAWQRALMFRTLALFVQAPLWGIAALAAGGATAASAATARDGEPAVASGPVLATWVVPAVGTAMLAIAIAQTITWRGLTDRLQAALAAHPAGCVEARDLPVEATALDHWGLTSTALVLEGPAPRHLVAIGLPCSALDGVGGLPTKIVDGVIVDRAAVDGWFDLSAIELGGVQAPP